MKKTTHLTTLLVLLLATGLAYSQKVAVIGMNHLSPDGISFVALEELPVSEVIYFTEDEYNNTTDLFSFGESVVQFVATSIIPAGDVVFIKEISTNTFTVNCTSGVCGTATKTPGSGSFALASGGEHIYAYSDTDDDPSNGVTEIYSVMYTIAGPIAPGEDPTVDHPNAIVVDGFANPSPDRTEFNFDPATLRDGVGISDFENPANYLNGVANADLSLVPFTNFTLGVDEQQIGLSVFPNPSTGQFNIQLRSEAQAVVFDILGKIVLEASLSAGFNSIDLSKAETGIYILNVRGSGITNTSIRLIKN